jgi:hypothetical protein
MEHFLVQLQTVAEDEIQDKIQLFSYKLIQLLNSNPKDILVPLVKILNSYFGGSKKQVVLACFLLRTILSSGRISSFESKLPMLMNTLTSSFEKVES